ncbi:MAG: hypothetical protein N2Z58_07300 [Fervidobacterium sp.]|nr:hypothetical protein [Fervidobacterium sp.]
MVNFDIPVDLPGATGVFALRILQEKATVGQVQVKLNYIVPFFVRFRNIPVYQSIKITNIFVRDLSEEPDDTYGDFESLITPEIENNDNIFFPPKGFENNDIRNSNRLFRFSDFSRKENLLYILHSLCFT